MNKTRCGQKNRQQVLWLIAAKRLVEKSNISHRINWIYHCNDDTWCSKSQLFARRLRRWAAMSTFDVSAACLVVFAASTGLKCWNWTRRIPRNRHIRQKQCSNSSREHQRLFFGDGAGAVLWRWSHFIRRNITKREGKKRRWTEIEALVAGKRMTNQTLSTMTMDGQALLDRIQQNYFSQYPDTLQKAGLLRCRQYWLYLLHQQICVEDRTSG